MAKFCTKCGKKLEDGQVCDCTKNETAVETATEPATQTVVVQKTGGFDFGACFQSLIDIVKGIFTKPSDTFKKYSKSENMGVGIMAIVINALVAGLFLYLILTNLINAGYQAAVMNSGLDSMTSLGLSSIGGTNVASALGIDFMKIFLYTAFFVAFEWFMIALMVYVFAGAIFKANIDFKKAISLVGTVSVLATVATAACIVLSYISGQLTVIVLCLTASFVGFYLYQALAETTDINKNRLAYAFIPALVIATVVVGFILWQVLVSSIMSWGASVSAAGDSLGSLFG